MGGHHSGGIYRCTPNDAWASRFFSLIDSWTLSNLMISHLFKGCQATLQWALFMMGSAESREQTSSSFLSQESKSSLEFGDLLRQLWDMPGREFWSCQLKQFRRQSKCNICADDGRPNFSGSMNKNVFITENREPDLQLTGYVAGVAISGPFAFYRELNRSINAIAPSGTYWPPKNNIFPRLPSPEAPLQVGTPNVPKF